MLADTFVPLIMIPEDMEDTVCPGYSEAKEFSILSREVVADLGRLEGLPKYISSCLSSERC